MEGATVGLGAVATEGVAMVVGKSSDGESQNTRLTFSNSLVFQSGFQIAHCYRVAHQIYCSMQLSVDIAFLFIFQSAKTTIKPTSLLSPTNNCNS